MRSRCVVIVIAVANAVANAVGVIAVAVRFGCGDALAQIARNKTNNTRHFPGKARQPLSQTPPRQHEEEAKKLLLGKKQL
jgi:hypothetical protein